MDKINVTGIAKGLDSALAAVQEMGKVAQSLGIVPNVATIAIAAAHIGQTILERAEKGSVVLASRDKALIEASLADLQAANDKLAGQVASS